VTTDDRDTPNGIDSFPWTPYKQGAAHIVRRHIGRNKEMPCLDPSFERTFIRRLVAIRATTWACGITHADITPGQVDAMSDHSAAIALNFQAGVLGACASVYPDIRPDVAKALRSLVPTMDDEKVPMIIKTIGQCMDKKRVMTKNRCIERAARLSSGRYDWRNPEVSPEFLEDVEMLNLCNKKRD
jgi:hypothetical protein